MQHYGELFAEVYNRYWAGFANQIAPQILAFYTHTDTGRANRAVLDLACGTGQLAAYFLDKGYSVTGVDRSEPMLRHARENTREHLATGRATFFQADMTSFALAGRFGLALSTYDAVNHLDDLEAVRRCAGCVHAALVKGGYFIFDLNTRKGLRRWNAISLEDGEEIFLVNRGIYDPPNPKAFTKITGFVRTGEGIYQRFDETVFNTVFELRQVEETLRAAGYAGVHYARHEDLKTPLVDPESESRVFLVAQK